MDKEELISNIAEKTGTSKAEAERFLEAFSETVDGIIGKNELRWKFNFTSLRVKREVGES